MNLPLDLTRDLTGVTHATPTFLWRRPSRALCRQHRDPDCERPLDRPAAGADRGSRAPNESSPGKPSA